MDDALAQLEVEFCPPLDSALLSAILSDYDLSKPDDLENARTILGSLKESAELEEQAGFDPSGTGGHQDVVEGARAESCPETSESQSRGTDVTSVSNHLSSLDLDEYYENVPIGEAEDLERLDQATKIRLLQDLFGKHVSRYSIEYTLKKCNGKWTPAMEELLNHVYFGEPQDSNDPRSISAKGIDAFSEENTVRRGRKGKAKNKRISNVQDKRSSSLPSSNEGSPAPQTNRWTSASEDINFIASRTGVAKATVSSIYYENNASMPQAIVALLKSTMEESKLVVTDESAVSSQALELSRDFPNVAPTYLSAFVRLTYPSLDAARELAEAMTAKTKSQATGGIEIIPRYAPVGDADLDPDWNTVTRKTRPDATSRSDINEPVSAAARRDAYAQARAAAFSQASAARRKANSDNLMSGAAAYYSQMSREYAALSSSASAAAADELAASQSTSSQLDLHGIDVLNAVRIAQDKVEEWWEGLGESRVNGRVGAVDRQAGYRIVVGLGRHSEGGKGKLGPAVSKMLRQKGWKIEATGPVIVVKGPLKR